MYTQDHINGYFQGLEQAKKVIQANPKKNHAQLIQSELTHGKMKARQDGLEVAEVIDNPPPPVWQQVVMAAIIGTTLFAILCAAVMQ